MRYWLLLVLVAAWLLGCAQPPPPETRAESAGEPAQPTVPATERTSDPVTLDLVWSVEPVLDPALTPSGRGALEALFMGLTRQNEQYETVPALAEEWTVSEDGRTYTFSLRDDVRWVRLEPASGQIVDEGPVTAEDVVYGILRSLDPRTGSGYAHVLHLIEGAAAYNTADRNATDLERLREAVGVRALDEQTVEFTLAYPAAYFPAILSLWVSYPQPRAAIEQHGEQWTEAGTVVTNGPYLLAQWQHESFLRLVKNPLWPEAATVGLEVIEGPVITEPATQLALYERGDVDQVMPPAADLARIRRNAELREQLVIHSPLTTVYIGFVTTRAPFDDPLVRRAFSAAIDRASLVQEVLQGGQVPAHTFAPPGVFGNASDDESIGAWMVQGNYSTQVAEARTWLAEAGYPEGAGIEAVVGTLNYGDFPRVTQVVQGMWQAAFPQAQLAVERHEVGAYLTMMAPTAPDAEKPALFTLGWRADYPDQNNWLRDVFHSASAHNSPRYNSPRYDELVEVAAAERDPIRRETLYAEAERLLVDEEAVIAPLYHATALTLNKPWLHNVGRDTPRGTPFYEWQIDWPAKLAGR